MNHQVDIEFNVRHQVLELNKLRWVKLDGRVRNCGKNIELCKEVLQISAHFPNKWILSNSHGKKICLHTDRPTWRLIMNGPLVVHPLQVWTATSPVYLLDERYMDDALGWERALHSQFSPDNKRLLVTGVKFGGNGEIVVYSIDGSLFFFDFCLCKK